MKYFSLLLIGLFFATLLTAQKQANYWFFGEYCGLNFNSGTPNAITSGSLTAMEGCSAISSETGVLHFYTDGISVWNRNNQTMPNGSGLMGNSSSSQSCIVVPWPEHNSKYFIFTIDDVDGGGGSNGLRYSVVNMSLNGTLGDVLATSKNILLTAPMCEKLTAVGHDNGIDTWIVSQKWGTNNFYSYLVTPAGVDMTPIISSGGAIIEGSIHNAKGCMKVSLNGEKLAKANAGLHAVEIFDFDNVTGQVDYIVTDNNIEGEAYGIEFSHNSRLLYVNTWKSNPQKKLYQYNLKAGTPNEILDSRVTIASGTDGALQIAPDNKMYVATNQSAYISVVKAPNKIGDDCDFNSNEVYLGGKTSRWGLPNFLHFFSSIHAGFYNDTPCYTVPTQFYENSSLEPDSVYWDFGNLASGADNYSTEFDPIHLFTGPGLYLVKHVIWDEGVSDSLTNGVFVNEKPNIQLGNDTSFCEGDTWVLDAGDNYETFLWSTGETTRTITVSLTGEYWCEVTSEYGCPNRDSIIVYHANPTAHAGNDQTIFYGQTAILDGSATGGLSPYTYEWQPVNMLMQNDIQNPETVPILTPTSFTLEVKDSRNCLSGLDYVVIQPISSVLSAMLTAEPDTICLGESTVITANASGGGFEYFYEWTSDPPEFTSLESSFTVSPSSSGNIVFLFNLTDEIDNHFDSTVTVVVKPLPVIDLVPDGIIPFGDPDTIIVCVYDTVILDAGQNDDLTGTTYYWTLTDYFGRYFQATSNDSLIDYQTHTVRVKYPGTNGCENIGEITIVFDFNECQIGVDENSLAEQNPFQIFPNPNNGTFALLLNKELRDLEIKVFDFQGSTVYTEQFEGTFKKGYQQQFQLDHMKKGIYFIQILSSSSSLSAQKLVIR